MRVLGVDPGLRLTGYACVEIEARGDAKLVEGGVIRLDGGAPVWERLVELERDLTEAVDRLAPELVAVEKVFTHRERLATGMLMAHARGVALLVAGRRAIAIAEIAPSEVKRAVGASGSAPKAQVHDCVHRQLGLSEPIEPTDVTDALAIAIGGHRRFELDGVLSGALRGPSIH